KRRRHPSG
nr:Chain A, PIMTIDE [Homo sapiens]